MNSLLQQPNNQNQPNRWTTLEVVIIVVVFLLIFSSYSCTSISDKIETEVSVLVDNTGSPEAIELPSSETVLRHLIGSGETRNFGSVRLFELNGFTGIKERSKASTNDPGMFYRLEKGKVKKDRFLLKHQVQEVLSSAQQLSYGSDQSRLYSNICKYFRSLESDPTINHVVYIASDLIENSDAYTLYNLTPYQIAAHEADIEAQLFQTCALPRRDNVTIYYAYAPQSVIEDRRYAVMQRIYTKLFAQAGYEVKFIDTN